MTKTTKQKFEALADVDTRETCWLFAGSLYDGDKSGKTVVVASILSSEASKRLAKKSRGRYRNSSGKTTEDLRQSYAFAVAEDSATTVCSTINQNSTVACCFSITVFFPFIYLLERLALRSRHTQQTGIIGCSPNCWTSNLNLRWA